METTEVTVYRQEDKTFRFTLKDADNNPIDLSSGFNNILIFLLNADGSVLEKYSRTVTLDYKTIDASEQADGVLSFLIDSDTLNLASLGKKYLEIMIRKTSGAVPDGNYDTIYKKYLFTLKQSYSGVITLP